MSEKPHSADYLGETRDYWWNRDFIELMSIRWNLAAVKTVLDVGCGIGHWGRCLAPFLPADCVLTGIDREGRWIEEARKRWAGIKHPVASFLLGEAERLPFPDDSFEMVTCQTVLIHVKKPLDVIREMIRVLAPGGLIVIVEPNNLVGNLSSVELQRPISEVIRHLEFVLTCERGKMNLGEGFDSCGPEVAGWLSTLNLEQIESHLSDKAVMLMPPYSSAHAQALIRETREMNQRDFCIWSREDTQRYFLAGGGAAEAFDDRWRSAHEREKELLSAVERGDLRITFAPVCLLVSGRKKAPNHAPDPTPAAVTPAANAPVAPAIGRGSS
jgi:SAM-dependent methyltransferase